MIVEDGTGLPNADSYVDPLGSWAVSYAAAWRYKDEWTAATDSEKEAACVLATRILDSEFDWFGTPMKVSTQALGWPRYITPTCRLVIPSNAVPSALAAATMEMALAMLQRNRTSDTSNGEAGITSLGLGDGAVDIKFGADPTTAPVDVVPVTVQTLLRNYGECAGGGMVPIRR